MKIETVSGISVVRMEEGKANAVGPAFLEALDTALGELEETRPTAAVFVGYEGYFSAGLDLPALQPLGRSAMRDLITLFSRTMLRVFELPFAVVAAVNGHAVAGGCVLALQADHRLMVDAPEARIGLKEVALGIGLPAVVVETLRCQVPGASLLTIALEARLFSSAEALAAGLVHEVTSREELLLRAIRRAESLGAMPREAFAQVKKALRAPVAEVVRARESAEAEHWLDTWFSDEGRRLVGETVAKLSKG